MQSVLRAQDADALEQTFIQPPDAAKPRTWWHWVSGNVSKEGITADLEAMARIGLGGAQIFTVDQSKVRGPVKFMGPEWRELVQHALKEAARLHLEISMEGCDGWSESGGPWVTPAESMQKVVWSTRQVHGGETVSLDLPQPETVRGFYRDIALLAFPTPPDSKSLPSPDKVTANDPRFDGAALLARDIQGATLTYDNPEGEQWLQFEYAQPVTVRSVRFAMTGEPGHPAWQVQTSEDGARFRQIGVVSSGVRTSLEPVTARFFRLFRSRGTKNSYRVTELAFGGALLPGLEAKTGAVASVEASRFVPMNLSPDEVVEPGAIIDLSGQREWQAPPGEYTVLRIGHTSTGVTTHPSTEAGLECDKLSATAVSHHLQNMYGPVLADSPAMAGSPFHYLLLDSWEAGCANWTPDMAAQFARLRGYDPTPWLPALSGVIIGSADLTQRFLWDFRRTVADLVAEMHYGVARDFAHQHGMELMAEATGIGMPTVADQLLCKKFTDVPMGEFWVNQPLSGRVDDPKEAASAAHIYGKAIASTESFTSVASTAAWKNDPFSLKALGDEEFCRGINRFIFHRYAHQPWLDRQPGMCMGPWGINFERTNTWWEPGRAWIEYLTRCEAMLQAGRFTADLCYFYGEGAPSTVRHDALKPAPPEGFDYDVCNADALLNRMSAADGRLVLPDGLSYRVLVLPPDDRMSLAVLRKIETLVHDGATVYGPKPLHDPSLTGYPQSDAAVAQLAAEVWGPCDGEAVKEHAYGAGRVVWGMPLAQALAAPPDFHAATEGLSFIHRQMHDGAEVYFVANPKNVDVWTDGVFRVTGMTPELWHPDTGARETLAEYRPENGQTTVPLHLDPSGSVFVVFRRKATGPPPVASLKRDGAPTRDGCELVADGTRVRMTAWQAGRYEITGGDDGVRTVEVPPLPPPVEIAGPWPVAFPPKLGAPANVTFDTLASWTESPDDGVKYFSGTATYTRDFTLPPEFFGPGRAGCLDLGTVKNLAEVTLNGHPLGVLWKAPFRVNIDGAARVGANHLEVKVTNLWPNRLIGDQAKPENERVTWASESLYKATDPLLPSGLLGPVRILPGQIVSF